MNDRIIAYIKTEIANEPLESIDVHEDLLGSGIIDSIGIVKLIAFLEREFQVKIPSEDMTVENFMTVHHISQFVANFKVQ